MSAFVHVLVLPLPLPFRFFEFVRLLALAFVFCLCSCLNSCLNFTSERSYVSLFVFCLQSAAARVAVQESQIKSPLDKHHADAVVNFLLRIACQVRVVYSTVCVGRYPIPTNCHKLSISVSQPASIGSMLPFILLIGICPVSKPFH